MARRSPLRVAGGEGIGEGVSKATPNDDFTGLMWLLRDFKEAGIPIPVAIVFVFVFLIPVQMPREEA